MGFCRGLRRARYQATMVDNTAINGDAYCIARDGLALGSILMGNPRSFFR